MKKLLSIILAAATAAALSVPTFAENAEKKSESLDNANSDINAEPEYSYIHAEIKENYISSYKLYEQVMYDQIVFYTNVSNGAITSDPVVIELPSELEATLERDGKEISFQNKREISEIGSYSLTIIASGSDILGGKDNELYYGLFRFRIMEAVAADNISADADIELTELEEVEWEDDEEEDYGQENEEEDGDEGEAKEDSVSQDDNGSGTGAEEDVVENDISGTSAADPDDNKTADNAAAGGSENSGSELEGDRDDSVPSSEGDGSMPQADKGLIGQVAQDEYVVLTTKAGTVIYSSIPMDASISGTVSLTFVTGVEYELYKDEKLLSGYKLQNLSDKGRYSLLIYDGSGTLPARLDFEIKGTRVCGIEEYTVPDGCEIVLASYEENPIRANKTSVQLGEDGEYSIKIACGDYTYTDSFTLDNTPPEFSLDRVVDGVAAGGTVTIIFESEDITLYSVYYEGELAAEQKRTMSEPGNYTIYVWDEAGNVTEKSFELQYRMDGMAIVVVVILGALVVAGVVFFVVSRRKFIVR